MLLLASEAVLGSRTFRLSPLQGFLLLQHPATSRLAAPDRIPVGACTFSQRLSSLIPSNLWSSPVQLPLLFKATQGLDGNKEHKKISQGALGNLKKMGRRKKESESALYLEVLAAVAVHLTLKGQILLSGSYGQPEPCQSAIVVGAWATSPGCSTCTARTASGIPEDLEIEFALKSPEDLCWQADTPLPKRVSHFQLETAPPQNSTSVRLKLQSSVLLEMDWCKNSYW